MKATGIKKPGSLLSPVIGALRARLTLTAR
ncbi:UNVERIFIED_ORG: hypothetical protein J3D59_004854 [Pseudomonas fluorescens]